MKTASQIEEARNKRKEENNKRRELKKLKVMMEAGGKALIPVSMYFTGSLIKLELGVCTGKKLYDKREDMKKKAVERDIEREMKDMTRL